MLKREIRVIGIDDSSFDKFKDSKVLIVGVLCRGGQSIDGVLSTTAAVDGKDSTAKIAGMINRCKFRPQLMAVFLNGIAVGGFNVIDVPRLHRMIRIPVIVVTRDYPDFKKIFNALKKLGMKEKIKIIEQMEKPVNYKRIYIQVAGITIDKAKEMLDITCTRSYIPEPLRIAHLIGAGIIKGESRGRA